MNITVFGANGATGQLLTRQALTTGHRVAAVTRRPCEFPIRHDRLRVVEADAHDAEAVELAVADADAVLSTLGVPYTRKPITVYSVGIRNIIAAMSHIGVKRVVAVSSSATYPHHHAEGGFLMNRVLQPLIAATIGRTTYADMRRMEAQLRASDLDWTIIRPSGLFNAAEVSRYQVYEDEAPGIFTSRIDLATCMLEQATGTRFVRKAVAVTTTVGTPTLWQMIRTEAFT